MLRARLALLAVTAAFFLSPLAPAGCADEELGGGSTRGAGGAGTGTSSGTGLGGGGHGNAGGGDGGGGGAAGEVLCPTTFTFKPPPGVSDVRIPGEWNGFDLASAART